jgi:hypothetical protein
MLDPLCGMSSYFRRSGKKVRILVSLEENGLRLR